MTEPLLPGEVRLDVSKLSDEAAMDALKQLAARFDVSTTPRGPVRDWAKATADGFGSENADGVLVLKLHTPIVHAGEKVTRVTVRRVRVKDMRGADAGLGTDVVRLTASIVEPPVFDDLESDADAAMFIAAGARQLGKYMGVPPTTSDAPSASSEGTSGSPRLI